METPHESRFGDAERTVPEEIAGLDVEVQAMFERVCTRLGLQSDGPQMLGRYELRGWIANGGMGEVYHAYDAELEREVAIKLVSPRPFGNLDKLRERLRREAKVLAKLDHANVVTVYDAGVENGRVFLVMQLVTGVTLRERQARKGCTLQERLRLYVEAGRGLIAAHECGIVHRDFKPDNVFVGEDDHARVGDFGLASMLGESEITDDAGSAEPVEPPLRMTRTGELLGTLGYMAPEQLRRQQPDVRSDQYAFCVSLWEGVTGVRPFAGANAKALLVTMEGEPRGGEWLPSRLRRTLGVGLAPRPEDRHASMVELLDLLERELGRPKRMLLTGLFILLGAAASAGLFIGWVNHRAANPDCPLADQIAELPASEHWSSLEAYTLPGTVARFEGYLEVLEAEAHEACVNKNLALEQQVGTLYRSLDLTLASLPAYDPDQRRRFVVEFEHALASRSTQAMSPAVSTFVAEVITKLEAKQDDEGVVAEVTEALGGLVETNVDRTELLLHRGRANSVLGNYEAAVADFKQARKYATAGDMDRRLRASVGAAKTTIMRRSGHLEAGTELLALVEDQLWGAQPWSSSLRADYLELSATLARHQGQLERDQGQREQALALLEQALALQRLVVLRHFVFASVYELIPALVNLGNIYSDRGQSSAAERSYRLALSLQPDDVEACLGLGRLLTNEDRLPDEARVLLRRVLATRGHDLYVAAATTLVELELYGNDQPTALAHVRDELISLLNSDHPGTADHQRQGWTFASLAFAKLGEFGPAFEDMQARVPEPGWEDEQLAYTRFELALAGFAAESPGANSDITARFLARVRARLQPLAASSERTELLKAASDLQRDLDQPTSP